VLLVSPSLQGHRLIYCRVLAAVFAGTGARVTVAGDTGAPGVAAHPLLADLRARPGVDVVDTGPARMFSAAALPGLVREAGADVLFCADADGLIGDPGLSAARRAAGAAVRTVGLYVRSTDFIHAPRQPLRRRLRDRAAGRKDAGREFHERAPFAYGLVDAALVLDERFAAAHADTHRWMPDIFREPAAGAAPEAEETASWRERLDAFLASAPRRPVVVYVGTNQERRGYDILLRLAVDEEASFVHCGRLEEHDGRDPAAVERLRAVLRERGALLETEGAYEHAATADAFLRAARCVVLPYRRHDGSSGVMLQALAAGRPVLVPDHGLMAFRATRFGVGTTFRDGDYPALRAGFRAAAARDPEAGAARLSAFVRCFSPEQLEAAVLAAVNGAGPGAELPQQVLPAERDEARC
jgi:glycosyltransferase involved in cell wall biosynthesis